MSDVQKLLIAFGAVIVVGFVVVAVGKSGDKKQQGMADALLTRQMLLNVSRDKCRDTIRDKLHIDVDFPSQTEGDGVTKAILTFRSGKEYGAIVCTYEQDRGVTSLAKDGAEVPLH